MFCTWGFLFNAKVDWKIDLISALERFMPRIEKKNLNIFFWDRMKTTMALLIFLKVQNRFSFISFSLPAFIRTMSCAIFNSPVGDKNRRWKYVFQKYWIFALEPFPVCFTIPQKIPLSLTIECVFSVRFTPTCSKSIVLFFPTLMGSEKKLRYQKTETLHSQNIEQI